MLGSQLLTSTASHSKAHLFCLQKEGAPSSGQLSVIDPIESPAPLISVRITYCQPQHNSRTMAESLFIPPGYQCWSLVWFLLIIMNSVFALHVREKVHFISARFIKYDALHV